MVIYTIRTTVGREKTVMESLVAKVNNKAAVIKGLVAPGELKGYVFVEGEEEEIVKIVQNVPHVRGLIKRSVPIEQLQKFFAAAPKEIKIKEGELVEVVGGPFKREKAKVVRIDELKREARIELVESAVPIPITIKLDLLKPIKVEKEEKAEEETAEGGEAQA